MDTSQPKLGLRINCYNKIITVTDEQQEQQQPEKIPTNKHSPNYMDIQFFCKKPIFASLKYWNKQLIMIF